MIPVAQMEGKGADLGDKYTVPPRHIRAGYSVYVGRFVCINKELEPGLCFTESRFGLRSVVEAATVKGGVENGGKSSYQENREKSAAYPARAKPRKAGYSRPPNGFGACLCCFGVSCAVACLHLRLGCESIVVVSKTADRVL